MQIRLTLFFLAALAWGQEPAIDTSGKGRPVPVEQCVDHKQEIQRLTTLLNWYQQQFFALQARQIEQQVAPAKPPRVEPPKPKEEKK